MPLPPKVFRLLEVLLENRPRALSKQELHDLIWPRTYVSDSSLARLAAELRRALGDDSRRPRYVRTAHGFGYAFAAPATPLVPHHPGPRSACRLLIGEAEVRLPPGEHLAGRGEDVAVRIDSPKVSRHHARIVVSPEGARIEDLGSRNGTYVRGRRVDGPSTLADGDEILIGPVLMIFRLGDAGSTETDVD